MPLSCFIASQADLRCADIASPASDEVPPGLLVAEPSMWVAPGQTHTGLHADVDVYLNLLVHVHGTKLVTLYPPGQHAELYASGASVHDGGLCVPETDDGGGVSEWWQLCPMVLGSDWVGDCQGWAEVGFVSAVVGGRSGSGRNTELLFPGGEAGHWEWQWERSGGGVLSLSQHKALRPPCAQQPRLIASCVPDQRAGTRLAI